MKLFKIKLVTTFIVGASAIVISGCGGSSAGNGEDTDKPFDPTDPIEKVMTQEQAKDAMALHAAIYPILAPISELSNCLTSTDAFKECLKDAVGVDTQSLGEIIRPGNTYTCTKNDNLTAPLHGTFKYDKDASGTVTFTFSDDCADYGNNKRLHENLVLKACLLDLNNIVRVDAGTAPTNGTYRVEYKGSVECSPGKKSGNYTYRTVGNSNTQDKMEWSYNGTLEFGSGKISADGSIRSIHRYATGSDTPSTPWDQFFLGSDQEWKFTNNTSITLGNDIVLNGKPTYIKHPNDWDGERGEGYEFYMSFESLAYNFLKNGRDITSAVSGKVSASCHPEQITYTTTTNMEDIDSLRDATFHRMPSSGEMSSVLEGYQKPTPAKFSASGSNAQVTVTAENTDVNYDSWKSIIDGSSCAQMNDFLVNLPQPPVKNPTPGEIIENNIIFEKEGSLVIAADKQSVVGKTDGRAVWYHLKREQGYTDGQTVAETNFKFAATGPQMIIVNVYLYDENGDPQRENVYSSADWVTLQNDPVKSRWTIRTDFMEGDLPRGVFYQGNFILRIGDSTYTGSGEDFTITKFVVNKI